MWVGLKEVKHWWIITKAQCTSVHFAQNHDDFIVLTILMYSLLMQITVHAHRALLCMMQKQLSIKQGVSLRCCSTEFSRSLRGTWSDFFGVKYQVLSVYDSPAYLGTLDSSMDQKQWSKANTCRGDSTGSVNTHFSHLSKHVQYNTTWVLAVLLLLWYKNRLIVPYCSMPPCSKSAGLSLSKWVRWSLSEYCSR